jgi:DegV family protein with EDD domain
MNEPAGRRVAIVTDSTCDIPRDLVAQYGIHVVPQILIMGQRTWQDGVDIDPPAFYELLQTSSEFPSSSQPHVVTFQTLFEKLGREYEGICAVLVSDELSGTINSAQVAAANLPEVPIEIVDSRSVSLQLGFIVLAAAQAAAAGQDLQAVTEVARSLIGRVHVYFLVDTLEYLHRGGRIGTASKLVGTALNLKPVLEVRDGLVQPLARVRTRTKALEKVLDLVAEQVAGADRVHMGVLHVAAPDEAVRFGERLRSRFQPVELIDGECGPVVGTHAGPGTLGVAFYTE